VTPFTRGAVRNPQYGLDPFTERAEVAVFAPFTARSQLEGNDMDDDPPTFEETYPKYEFSELVRMAIGLGAWITGMCRRAKAPRLDAPTQAAERQLRAD
jgi:hypothetical protein